jgi:hypothetical protein
MSRIRIAAIVLCILAFSASLHAEFIFLKDGTIQQGKITRDAADSITVEFKDGTTKNFPRETILRILYTEMYMGKYYIWLKTGGMVEAYQVDEDSETYMFRKDMSKPDEFAVKRANVLFMARANPTELAGRPGRNSIRLSWVAPYKTPRRYHVYMKENRGDPYRLAGKTIVKCFELTKLPTKKAYFFKVTAIGRDGKESEPTNEIEIMTNIPPGIPADLRSVMLNKKKKTADVKLTWKQAKDPDGTVTGYRVYQRRQYDIKKIMDVADTAAAIPEVQLDRDTHFIVRAVDSDNAESINGTVDLLLRRINLTARLGCVIPVGDFWDLMDAGCAVMVNASVSNFWINHLYAGLDVGYMRMNCKMDRSYALNMVPVAAAAAYEFEIIPNLSLMPRLSVGIAWMGTEVLKNSLSTVLFPMKSSSVEPLIGLGVSAHYQVLEMLSAGLEFSYGMIIEKEPMHFLTLTGGCTLRFGI